RAKRKRTPFSMPKFLTAIAGCLFFVLFVIYFPFLSGQLNFCLSDINLEFEPFCRYMSESLHSGSLPLWNPYPGLGVSQIACPWPGVFYPLNMLFALMPFSQALAVFLVVHQLIAAAGGYLLARRTGLSRDGAIVCGIALGLNGYIFSM